MKDNIRIALGIIFLTACAANVDGPGDPDDPDQPVDPDDPNDPDADIVVDDEGFFVDKDVRWSSIAAPTITGTIRGSATQVDARAGSVTLADGLVTGGRWSITLPVGALDVAPIALTFVALDEIKERGSVSKTFAVDVTPPVITAIPTEVANELNDLVQLGTDGTILSHEHTTIGETTLGGNGCPDVFKHAYLMDPDDSNPIRWQLRATDDGVGLDPTAALVRIGKKDGTLFSSWRPIAGSDAGDSLEFEFDALRTIDPFLATTEDEMVIQLSTKDRFDREVVFERCWNHHPLAVPLLATAASQAAGHPLALASNRLESGAFFHNHAAELINAGSDGLSILDYDLFNGSTERALVTLTLTRPQLFSRRDYVKQSAVQSVRNLAVGERIPCNEGNSDPRCEPPAHPNRVTSIGSTLQESTERFVVRVFEIAADGSLGTEVPCATCNVNAGVWTFDLAGKASQAAFGKHYRVMTGVREMTNLAPSGGAGDIDVGPFTEATLKTTVGDFGITGKLIGSKYKGCTNFVFVPIGNTGNENVFCTQLTELQHYRALTRIDVSFNAPLQNQPTASPANGVTPRATGTLVGARKLTAFSYNTIEALPLGF